LIGIELRPRLPHLKTELGSTERADAPGLFSIIDDVAGKVGSPRIDLLVVDESYNAWCGRFGIRRRCVLGLGLPLWAALNAEGPIALLGHELGHLVNGDPGQGLLTQPALTTFGRLASLFNPRHMQGRHGLLEWMAALFSYILFTPLYLLCRWLHFLLCTIAARDRQRAEYYADALAVQLAGTLGAVELMNRLVHAEAVLTAVRRAARTSPEPSAWRDAAQHAIASSPDGGTRLEQHSIRIEASLFATHPPAGLRRRMVKAWNPNQPQFSIAAERLDQADAEIKRPYARVARVLAQHA
jgi:heat shock protein HtpX